MRAAVFLTSGTMRFARESGMASFPTIMALRNSWIHVRFSNSGDTSSIVE